MIIRPGKKNDIPEVFNLIKELAEFEKAPEKVTNSVERLEEDGFGPNPVYELFVAENKFKIVGIALTYYRYSTWRGKVLYLEDIIVKEALRRKGIGGKIFDFVFIFFLNYRYEKCIRRRFRRMLIRSFNWLV